MFGLGRRSNGEPRNLEEAVGWIYMNPEASVTVTSRVSGLEAKIVHPETFERLLREAGYARVSQVEGATRGGMS